jgi:hypothetical protein
MPGGNVHSVKGNVTTKRVTASQPEDLACVMSLKVLSYDGAWCMTIRMRGSSRQWLQSTSDENIMLYSSWKNAKVHVIYVFTCIP